MTPDLRVRLEIPALAAALAVLGGLLVRPWADAQAAAGGRPAPVLVAALGLLFVLSGIFVAHVRYGRESQDISLRDTAIVVGLALLPPLTYVVVHLACALLPLVLRRLPPTKVLFNAGMYAAEVGLGVTVYRLVGGGADPSGGRGLAAGLVAVGLVSLLSGLCVTAVIALHRGTAASPRWTVQAVGLLTSLASGTVGLLAVVLVLREPVALPLLGVLLGVLALAYRSQLRLTLGNERLEVLYAFARASGQALSDDTVAHTVLVQTRELMAAETAELHLPWLDPTQSGLRLTEQGLVPAGSADDDPWWAPALQGHPVHRTPQDTGAGPQDALAAPLYQDGEVMGALVVVDRMGAEERFGGSDAKVFGALAGTASVSLHNAGLVARLRQEAAVREHSARHDALTGLPNRQGFREAVQHRLDPRPAVVMVVDVEGFQEVNDALGQSFGDELLVAVGRRLGRALGADVVARLSGDEFAVLLPGSDQAGSALQVEAALLEPFGVGQVRLPVRVRIGTARLPADGTDPDLLVRRADLALHRAKREHGRAAHFVPQDEAASSERLALVGDLREALAAGDLRVFYQPQLDLRSGRVLSVEALVRWTHAARGAVPPDVFVPLAESAGLVDELTETVLGTALRDLRRWRDDGLLQGVAVNLSARSLGPALPGVLERALDVARLPAEALTLELTETAVVTAPEQAAEVLTELAALGCSLSLDDFGTGYSSMSYLRTLPMDEIKVDRSFVFQMATNAQDAAVVRATVQLAHDLGKRVVAEGVEDEAALSALRDLDCDGIQGWLISRPAPAEQLTGWLRQHVAVAAAV